jgi:hypothetical protein
VMDSQHESGTFVNSRRPVLLCSPERPPTEAALLPVALFKEAAQMGL